MYLEKTKCTGHCGGKEVFIVLLQDMRSVTPKSKVTIRDWIQRNKKGCVGKISKLEGKRVKCCHVISEEFPDLVVKYRNIMEQQNRQQNLDVTNVVTNQQVAGESSSGADS